jgi:hypothetical protein
MLVLIGHVRAEPLPQSKVGKCPSGYRESEGYCAPLNDRAPAAVPKIGSCPSGWTQALTAPTLDGADVALQAREKHLHRGLTPLVFRPSTAASSPPMPHAAAFKKAHAKPQK